MEQKPRNIVKKIRVYDREALLRFYQKEFPGVSMMMDWRYLEADDRRIEVQQPTGRPGVYPMSETLPEPSPSPEVAVRVNRALAECPWRWEEIKEPPLSSPATS